jgi:predicted acyl esterase
MSESSAPQRILDSSGEAPVEVIYRKPKSLDDPTCQYPGFQPGVSVVDGVRMERDVAVKMRDGITIYTDIYRPDGAENVPAIIAWSPYGKQPIERPIRGVAAGVVSRYAKFEGPDPMYWCKCGYTIVNPDARGAFKSEGNIRLASSAEGQDIHDLIEWVAVQDWCSGKVGASGNSWLALSQWFAAAEQPPHLAAIAPWEGWTDFYRQMISPGGIPEVGFIGFLIGLQCGTGSIEDAIAMIHKYPLMNSYWEDKIAHLEKITVPASITANFNHFHALGSLDAFRRIPSREKWLRVTPNFEWPDYYDPDHVEDLRRFFDHYLKGIQNDWELTPQVRLSVFDPGGLNQTNRPENEWPLARTKYEKLYLDASSGSLSPQPVSQESQTQYATDYGQANFVIRFDRETELTGYMKLRLWVEAEAADDLDLFIYVQKLDRRGKFLPNPILRCPHPGAQGWLRVSHRELDPACSTPSEPYLTHRRIQLLLPKEIVPVEIGIWPTSMVWHPGQQLRVIVTGHYMETRGPDWWESFRYESLDRGTCIIHTGGRYDSHLLVPRIPMTSNV